MSLLFPSQALDFLLLIFAAAVMVWADHEAPLLLGLSASWLPWHRENGASGPATTALLGRSPMHRVAVQEVLTFLPSSMLLLLQKEPWKEQTQKVRGGSCLLSRAGRLLSPALAAVGWKWALNKAWIAPKYHSMPCPGDRGQPRLVVSIVERQHPQKHNSFMVRGS